MTRKGFTLVELPAVCSGKCKAFTLVELLVVIAIIGILVALLLPAVQAAREAARRIHCVNNFKQVGIAMHNYYDAKKSFPPGISQYHVGSCAAPSGATRNVAENGWSFYLLPFLEETSVNDKFNLNIDPTTGQHVDQSIARTYVKSYLCPSDPQGPVLVHYGSQPEWFHQTTHAKTNMSGVADTKDHTCGGTSWIRRDGNGMLFQESYLNLRKVTDGTSKTLMVGEIVGAAGSTGTYAGQPTGSALAWYYYNVFHTGNGINLYVPAKNVWSKVDNSFASYHPGGCHFVLVDGSVQFVNEAIDRTTLSALTTRKGGEVIDHNF